MMSPLFKSIFVLIVTINICLAQLGQIVNGPISYVGDPRYPRVSHQGPPIAITDSSQLGHPAVIENSILESQYPPELLKSNRFYSNPHIASGLARESWLTSKEAPVFEREADKIPREQVFKIFKNAGFLERRKRYVHFY